MIIRAAHEVDAQAMGRVMVATYASCGCVTSRNYRTSLPHKGHKALGALLVCWVVLGKEFKPDLLLLVQAQREGDRDEEQHINTDDTVGDTMMPRTRYQGAIIRDHHILLLKQIEHASGRSSWQIPGGGIEPDETEAQCVQREMLEETGLEVRIDSLLLDEPSPPGSIYQRWKTYRCAILAGEAHPGCEPEAAYADAYSFTEVNWFDLRHPATWNGRLEAHSYIAAWLHRVQAVLGYVFAVGLQDGTGDMQ